MNKNINKLLTVVQVLNNIDTRGKQNLVNLGGAIGLIEDVIADIVKICNTVAEAPEGDVAECDVA